MTIFSTWFQERRVYRGDSCGQNTIMYLDSCGGIMVLRTLPHLAETKTKMSYIPPRSTHLVQRCDSFVISKIKDEWARLWEVERMRMIRANE